MYDLIVYSQMQLNWLYVNFPENHQDNQIFFTYLGGHSYYSNVPSSERPKFHRKHFVWMYTLTVIIILSFNLMYWNIFYSIVYEYQDI